MAPSLYLINFDPKTIVIAELQLSLDKDSYQQYLSFLFQINQQYKTKIQTLYLQKDVFDSVIQDFGSDKLMILQQKQDMYMHYIMYSTLYNINKLTEEEFIQNVDQLISYHQANNDEILLMSEIENIVKQRVEQKISPFYYLQACVQIFSQKLRIKLSDILMYMIGDYFCYKLNPAIIFGICFHWAVCKYHISNQSIKQLISNFIDVQNEKIKNLISKMKEMMEEILGINQQQ